MKTVCITGASRGIGRALVQHFLEENFAVIGTSRSGSSTLTHTSLVILPLELSEEASRNRMAQKLRDLNRKIDILINNAGIWHPKDDRTEINLTTLRETLEVNFFGTIDLTEQLLPLMNDGGHIVNISSRRGSMNYTTKSLYPCYSLSKAGLNMFTRLLAERCRQTLTVSCMHPGFVKTEMNDGEGERTPEEVAKEIFQLAISRPETGQFWYKGKKFPW